MRPLAREADKSFTFGHWTLTQTLTLHDLCTAVHNRSEKLRDRKPRAKKRPALTHYNATQKGRPPATVGGVAGWPTDYKSGVFHSVSFACTRRGRPC